MPDEFGEKTEQPTDRRRQEARDKGNVARSTDLNAAGLVLAAALAIAMLSLPLARSMAELMHGSLREPGWIQIDRGLVMQRFGDLARHLAAGVLPLLLLLAGTALLVNVLQVGFLLSPEVLQPKLSRLNPLEGAKRIFSVRGLVRLGVSLGKLLLLTAIAGWFISGRLPQFLLLDDAEPGGLLMVVQSSATTLAFLLALALLALALLDFGFQKWKHEQDLMMSRQEVRDEMKQMEGDPLVRQRRREAHRKLAQARELSQVPDADVVITNPTEIAVALKYDPERMPAPIVVAKGMGELAARIRRIALEHDVPILERKPLARALYHDVKVGHPIPGDMYEVFVEIMAYVYRLKGRKLA